MNPTKKTQNKRFKSGQSGRQSNSRKRAKNRNSKGRQNSNQFSPDDILSGVSIASLTKKSSRAKKTHLSQRTNFPEDALPPIVEPDRKHEDIPQDIDLPTLAIFNDTSKEAVDFDTALEQLNKTEDLAEDEQIAYIGKGEFAVVAYKVVENPRKKTSPKKVLEIRRKIVFENHREDLSWRNNLCFELSLSYKPNPNPLSELYTKEELESFSEYN